MSVCKTEFQAKHFGFADCPPKLFYVTQWSSNPWFLWGWKLFACLYWFSMFVANLVTLRDPSRYWIFLTNWGVMLIILYFFYSMVVCTYGILNRRSWVGPQTDITLNTVSGTVNNENQTPQIPVVPLRWFHQFLWQLQSVATNVSLMITVLYWALLTPNLSLFSINNHIINLVIMLIDFFIVAIPTRLLHFVYTSLFSTSYVVFILILHGARYESAVYSVVDWAKHPGLAAGVSVAVIFVASPIAHGIFWCFFQLRVYLGKKVNPPIEPAVAMTSHPSDIVMTSKGEVNPAFE